MIRSRKEVMAMEQEQIQNLMEEVIGREWRMFTSVSALDGRSPCQDDKRTFEIMRASQFQVWGREALLSYQEDLKEAEAAGRNMMAEKYGYMMEYTASEEYENIRELLPEVTEEKSELAEKLVRMQIRWMEDFKRRYPDYGIRGRPLRRQDEGEGMETSIETYSRGEFLTYSVRTLEILNEQLKELERKEENPGIRIMDYTARQYGYESSKDAQERLEKQRKSRSL